MKIEKALRLPLENGGVTRILIGALLNLIPIVNFLCTGYLVEIMEKTIKGKQEMPIWEDWGRKFIKGLMVFIISLLYMLIPIIFFGVGGGIGIIFGGGFSLFTILGILVGLAVWFILPMAIAHYAVTGKISASFNFSTLLAYIRAASGTYLNAYFISIGLFMALGILTLIPVLGWIICFFGGFYVGCVLSLLFGEAYRKGSLAGEKYTTMGF